VVVHLYGVTTPDASPPKGLRGRQDADLRLVTDDRLAVIVSDVDAEAPAGRKDLLAHAHVLEAYADRANVIPMQFGIALPDDDMVREQVLEQDRESLEGLLTSFDGLLQLTVQAFHHEEAALREVMRRRPDLVAARDQMRTFPETATQGRQVELGQAVAAALEDLEEEDRLVMLDALAPLTVAVAEHDGGGAHEVLHAAFLVERDAQPEFDEAVTRLREDNEERMRIRYVGPQPPYSFLEAMRTGELSWG
jgi:Gas vesicle synthesis protein GvpL/GvpF